MKTLILAVLVISFIIVGCSSNIDKTTKLPDSYVTCQEGVVTLISPSGDPENPGSMNEEAVLVFDPVVEDLNFVPCDWKSGEKYVSE